MSSGALDIKIEATGLPNRPAGSVVARGDLLAAPLDLAVAFRQADNGLAIEIEQAAWKSLKAAGTVQLATATMQPSGKLTMTIGRLADLSPLIGRPVSGRVQATFSGSSADPAHPTVDAQVDAEAIELSGLNGTAHASARGAIDALDVRLAASSPNLQGSPARIEAAAKVTPWGGRWSLGRCKPNGAPRRCACCRRCGSAFPMA